VLGKTNMSRRISIASIVGFGMLFVISVAACSGASDSSSPSPTSDELNSTKECGGFVAHPKHCKAGYTCVPSKINPDLPGTCERTKYCVIDCAVGTHFVQDDNGCRCEPDATPTCAQHGGTCMSPTACDNAVQAHDGFCDGTAGLCTGTKICYIGG
jgi:hypothetical protein